MNRYADDPNIKEKVFAELFGKFKGYLESKGFKDDEEFKATIIEVFSCSKRYIHLFDLDKSKEKQLVLFMNSGNLSMQVGVATKNPLKTVWKEELNDLRYKLSDGTQAELIDSHKKKFEDFFKIFEKGVLEVCS